MEYHDTGHREQIKDIQDIVRGTMQVLELGSHFSGIAYSITSMTNSSIPMQRAQTHKRVPAQRQLSHAQHGGPVGHGAMGTTQHILHLSNTILSQVRACQSNNQAV